MMANGPDIKQNLSMAMNMAAFTGVAWYISIELNIRLFLLFKRRKGLYFWSCALFSWGIILQPLCIILADFGVWKDLKGSITPIYLDWWLIVIPQALVMYSRLHLVVCSRRYLRWVLSLIIFDIVVFFIPTIIICILAQATLTIPSYVNLIWDRKSPSSSFRKYSLCSLHSSDAETPQRRLSSATVL
ncbi:hypothetical protein GQ43DRAFT_487779 [Delitschia confertaspora ATCC 74209]|uniref:DUF7703 domain-containing protein n=1 Tax=Delitschia confertaspora ATCC 74209 TaxID=1513339 RepID=A0A9P4JN19_9PLEO|nr:hypothetical protein GQ43DRAFT_487779 [Delitschia confertaspora ATCC 74209]